MALVHPLVRPLVRPLANVLTLGGATLSATLIAKAEKIIAGQDAYSGVSNMSSAPTLSLGSTGGASTINGNSLNSPQFLITDETRFLGTGGDNWTVHSSGSAFGYTEGISSQSGLVIDGGQGWGFATQVTGTLQAFDIGFRGNATAIRWRVRINGEWAQTADYSSAVSSGARAYAKCTLASGIVDPLVEVFFDQNVYVVGMNFTTGCTLAAPSRASNVTAEIWWDSYAKGNTGWNLRDTPAQLFGQKLGVRDICCQGRAGQGYVAQQDSRTIAGRISLDKAFANPTYDLVVMPNSVNDNAQDYATVAANMVMGLQTLQVAYPDTWLFVPVGFSASGADVNSTEIATMVAALNAAADNRTIVIDGTSWPQVTNTGTLPDMSSHDSPDNVHPGPNETNYLTDLMVSTLIASLVGAIA